MEIESLKDKINITDKTNPFLDMKQPTIDLINSLSNQKVWIRILDNNDNSCYEEICTLNKMDDETNMVEVNTKIGNKNISYESIIGIEGLNDSYNEDNIDFPSYVEKAVRITNYRDDKVECIIQDVDTDDISFAVRIPEYKTLSYDLSYPKNLIKKIELI